MSYTYTQEIAAPEADTTFVPSYARKSVKPKKFKTWMVLAPIAGIALIGGATAMLMNSGGEVQPLAEPAATPAAVIQPAPLSSAPLTSAAPVQVPVMDAQPAPTSVAPVARLAEPVRQTAAAPARRAVAAPVVTPTVQAPVEATGPRAYEASPTVASPTTAAPTTATPASPAPVAAAPAPNISVAPLN